MRKTCVSCREEKPLVEFSRDKSKRDGYNIYCKKCISARNKLYRTKDPKKHGELARARQKIYYFKNKERIKELRGDKYKESARARQELYRTKDPEKYKESSRARQKRYSSKHPEKMRANQKLYRSRNPEKVLNRYLKREYGLLLSDYEAMLSSQNGCCAICKRPPGKRRLAVDHDHATGEIRELLCIQCNKMLGLADDNDGILLRAIDYLRHHRRHLKAV